ncbi:uncharacterized protein LOC144148856 [Haemaphysalis longicornis]
MRERVNTLMCLIAVLVAVVLLAIGLAFTFFVMAMAKPGSRRSFGGYAEDTTTTTEPTTKATHRRKHPKVLVEDVGATRRPDAGGLCQAPRLVHCSSNLAPVLGEAWFYMPGATAKGSCLQWLPDHLCSRPDDAGRGEAFRFESLQECSEHCERGSPEQQCTRAVPLSAIYNCTDGGGARRGAEAGSASSNRSEYWFYDPVGHACSKWKDVCVYKSYATMAACVKDCLPEA